MSIFCLLLLALTLSASASRPKPPPPPPPTGHCAFSSAGANYDLAPLSSQSFQVKDQRALEWSRNYTYVLRVCEDIVSPPKTNFPDYDACNITEGSFGQEMNGPAPAFQIYNWANSCHRLGNSSKSAVWGLFDESNPSRGVILKYIGGDMCSSGRRREISLEFECYDTPLCVPGEEQTVLEYDDCHYRLFVRSHCGCPTECPIRNHNLCAGHGLCDYDYDRRSPRCYCHKGFSGDDCGTVDHGSGGVSGTLVMLVIMSVLLVIAASTMVYITLQMRRLRLDPSAYQQLDGGVLEKQDVELTPTNDLEPLEDEGPPDSE